jgi:hypothetical protein
MEAKDIGDGRDGVSKPPPGPADGEHDPIETGGRRFERESWRSAFFAANAKGAGIPRPLS